MSCGLTLRFDRKLVGVGHDQHDRVAGGDDAADSVHRGLKHHAVLRRADVDALELVLGGDLALDEFADLAVDLARLLGDLAAQIAVDLDDLQLGFGDLAGGLRGLRDQLPGFAIEPRRLALKFGQLGERHKLVLPEISTPAASRLISWICFSLESFCAWKPRISSLSCSMRWRKLRLLPDARAAAQLEQLALAIHDAGDIGIVGLRQQLGRKLHAVGAVALALQPRLARGKLVRPLVTMARLARVTVSSRRTRICPAFTWSPSCTSNSPTMPPVGCCTFFTLESTTI